MVQRSWLRCQPLQCSQQRVALCFILLLAIQSSEASRFRHAFLIRNRGGASPSLYEDARKEFHQFVSTTLQDCRSTIKERISTLEEDIRVESKLEEEKGSESLPVDDVGCDARLDLKDIFDNTADSDSLENDLSGAFRLSANGSSEGNIDSADDVDITPDVELFSVRVQHEIGDEDKVHENTEASTPDEPIDIADSFLSVDTEGEQVESFLLNPSIEVTSQQPEEVAAAGDSAFETPPMRYSDNEPERLDDSNEGQGEMLHDGKPSVETISAIDTHEVRSSIPAPSADTDQAFSVTELDQSTETASVSSVVVDKESRSTDMEFGKYSADGASPANESDGVTLEVTEDIEEMFFDARELDLLDDQFDSGRKDVPLNAVTGSTPDPIIPDDFIQPDDTIFHDAKEFQQITGVLEPNAQTRSTPDPIIPDDCIQPDDTIFHDAREFQQTSEVQEPNAVTGSAQDPIIPDDSIQPDDTIFHDVKEFQQIAGVLELGQDADRGNNDDILDMGKFEYTDESIFHDANQFQHSTGDPEIDQRFEEESVGTDLHTTTASSREFEDSEEGLFHSATLFPQTIVSPEDDEANEEDDGLNKIKISTLADRKLRHEGKENFFDALQFPEEKGESCALNKSITHTGPGSELQKPKPIDFVVGDTDEEGDAVVGRLSPDEQEPKTTDSRRARKRLTKKGKKVKTRIDSAKENVDDGGKKRRKRKSEATKTKRSIDAAKARSTRATQKRRSQTEKQKTPSVKKKRKAASTEVEQTARSLMGKDVDPPSLEKRKTSTKKRAGEFSGRIKSGGAKTTKPKRSRSVNKKVRFEEIPKEIDSEPDDDSANEIGITTILQSILKSIGFTFSLALFFLAASAVGNLVLQLRELITTKR